MKKHTVAVLGTGVRGKTHIKGLLENPDRYEIVALCDLDKEKMESVAKHFDLHVPLYTDAETMLKETQPEVFVFLTLPNLRLSFIELANKYHIKAISFEKPMAESLAEAKAIRDLCVENGIKAVVCHQQKYLRQMQAMKKRIDDGEIGEITKIHVETQPWLAQLGTHYVDYTLWANNGHKAKWVVGHVHGNATLQDSHPSPDYLLGEMMMENGVRAYIECGYLSEAHGEPDYADCDNRITVYGKNGYVYAETDGYYGACTKATGGELIEGKLPGWYNYQEKEIQTPYYTEYADWLDDDSKPHSCNIDISYHGYEILEGMCLSALNNTRVDMPITDFDYEPVFERMKRELPDVGTKLRKLYDGKNPRPEHDHLNTEE
ncbi:MAG: Gfo/Idh/MocA family protein [Lachnospiraceae bacterium]|jgi:predicted dehydrogenase